MSTPGKKDAINNLKVAIEYFTESRYYFLEAEAEELEGAYDSAKYLKEIIKLIKDKLYLVQN